jgi:sensor c-di-GMP phosphodiesterase-like protein
MDDDPDSQEIVKLIIAMAHALDLNVVAEGTETDKQVSILKAGSEIIDAQTHVESLQFGKHL